MARKQFEREMGREDILCGDAARIERYETSHAKGGLDRRITGIKNCVICQCDGTLAQVVQCRINANALAKERTQSAGFADAEIATMAIRSCSAQGLIRIATKIGEVGQP